MVVSFRRISRLIRAWLQLSLAGCATVALQSWSRTTVWRMDHRAGALPILFMRAAETEAACLQFCCCLQKNPPSSRRWESVNDALGEFRLFAALTKLSQSAQGTRFITGRNIQL